MATTKAKTTTKKSSAKKTTKSTKTAATKAVKTEKVEPTVTTKETSGKFFARKYDASENILTIFKSPKIIGAILGEIIGTMIISMILLTLGMFNPLYLIFGIMAVTIAVYAFSGANLNPTITVGLMATRRMSPIRGTLYIISQVLGAWFGLLVVSAFHSAGGDVAQAIPSLAVTLSGEESIFWAVAMVEMIGAIIIGFSFARALVYKRSVFTFGAVVAGGVFIAVLLAVIFSGNYLGLSDNSFVLNPAIAIMYQALPSEAATFGELLGQLGLALSAFVVFPMVGGTIGFYLSDVAAKLSEQKLEA